MGTAPKGDHERSLGQLTGDLVNQVATLMRDELGLAKVEMAEKGKWAGVGAGLSSASGVAAFFGAGCLTACAVAALSLVMPVWAAALIVGGFYLAVAGVVFLLGRNQMRRAAPPVPEETVESLKEDVECLKAHARSTRP
jgi:hypothetical protein